MQKPASAVILVALVSILALGQESTKHPGASATAMAKKATLVAGTISSDGKMFIRDSDNTVWKIINADSAKGFEGQSIRLQGVFSPEQYEIEVLVIKSKRQPEYVSQKDDSAFRR